MGQILLTPEERLNAEDKALEYLHSQGKVVGKGGFTRMDIAFTVRLFIAKAQLRNIYEWGNTYCYNQEHIKVEGSVRMKRLCYGCWQALLKEVEE